ncbi:MAG: phosphoglucosamine mutase [Planctomycetota bacterium]
MAEPIISISGVRGVVGETLGPEFVVRYAAALGRWTGGGPVVLGYDGRVSGPMLVDAAKAGLVSAGCRVLYAGVAATPTIGVLVTEHGAAAGLQVSASHNPIEWNGLKPFGPFGGVLNAEQGGRLLAKFRDAAKPSRPWGELGRFDVLKNPGSVHIDRIVGRVDVEAVGGRAPHVVLDCCHGAGAVATPRLLEKLGCRMTRVGWPPNGRFERDPEPLAKNLAATCAVVRDSDADVGFVQDPDADRLAVIDGDGRYIGEELTLALVLDELLPEIETPVVVNGSTSRVNADVAARHGRAFHRSAVGEANVVAKMREVGSKLGGEGNGGVIDLRIGPVRDSLFGIAVILQGLARRGGSLAEWVATLPSYAIVKQKFPCDRTRLDAVLDAVTAKFADGAAARGDGLRVDWPDRWVQVRASNTEPVVRVIAEAPQETEAAALAAAAGEIVTAVGGPVGV